MNICSCKTLQLALFCERFPKYALFAFHWEPVPYKPIPLPTSDLSKIEVLYLYDMAASYSECKGWLSENPDRRLVLLETSPGTIASLFLEETDLFHNAQVDIELMPIDVSALAERYPVERIEVMGNRKIRLELLWQTTLSHARFIEKLHGYQTFDQFVCNLPYVKQAFYANGLRNAFQGHVAIVCGAGPSLQQVVELLKERDQKALVIAGGSAVPYLSACGVIPHFGIAIDPNLNEYHRFSNGSLIQCPLLFSTRLFSDVFRTCNGPFGYLRAGIGGAPELWMEEELGLTDPLLGQNLSCEALSVTSICLAFAQHIGCSTVILAGVDLAYTGGRRYAEETSEEKTHIQRIESEKIAIDRILRRKDKRGKFVHTAVRWVMEAAALAHFASKHPEIRWINATDGGLRIDGFEEMLLDHFPASPENWDFREKITELIALHPMPTSEKDLLGELRMSLERFIVHLEVLAEEKKGSKALAEWEMKEELVASLLFYDMPTLLRQSRRSDKWVLYLEIARKYLLILHSRTRGVYSGVSGR